MVAAAQNRFLHRVFCSVVYLAPDVFAGQVNGIFRGQKQRLLPVVLAICGSIYWGIGFLRSFLFTVITVL